MCIYICVFVCVCVCLCVNVYRTMYKPIQEITLKRLFATLDFLEFFEKMMFTYNFL